MQTFRFAFRILLGGLLGFGPVAGQTSRASSVARGIVFNDLNKDQKHEANEPGIAGVRVSNGRDFATTGDNGRYELPIEDEMVLYVVKPRNWLPPLSAENLPRFYYVHQPAGSPPEIAMFPGVAPTGPLPASIDFPLVAHAEPDEYDVLIFGDTQPRDVREVEYIAHDVVEPLIGTTTAAFGVTLGDVVFDNLSVFEPLHQVIGRIGVPWFLVPGNHDINFDATGDRHSLETWKRLYGPPYYAFDWGPVHWVVLDNVVYEGRVDNEPKYHGEFGREQLEWLRKDLASVPPEQLVVCMMHIPAPDYYKEPGVVCSDARAFFELLSQRPHVLTLSAHMHMAQSMFVERREGWSGPSPHLHFNAGTVCGSWWTGVPDERGIPHTMMRDGGPNGHYVMSIRGNQYSMEFVPAGRPRAEQMSIFAAEEIVAGDGSDARVFVNVFNGSERSTVEMRGGDGPWTPLERTDMVDPYYQRLKEQEQRFALPGRKLPAAVASTHIWVGALPAGLPPGTHVIEVRTRDVFGQEYRGMRLVRVR